MRTRPDGAEPCPSCGSSGCVEYNHREYACADCEGVGHLTVERRAELNAKWGEAEAHRQALDAIEEELSDLDSKKLGNVLNWLREYKTKFTFGGPA